jgi:hypothetical protein
MPQFAGLSTVLRHWDRPECLNPSPLDGLRVPARPPCSGHDACCDLRADNNKDGTDSTRKSPQPASITDEAQREGVQSSATPPCSSSLETKLVETHAANDCRSQMIEEPGTGFEPVACISADRGLGSILAER